MHTILAYTPRQSLSVHIVCSLCVHAYLLHTNLPSVRSMHNVCICRIAHFMCTTHPVQNLIPGGHSPTPAGSQTLTNTHSPCSTRQDPHPARPIPHNTRVHPSGLLTARTKLARTLLGPLARRAPGYMPRGSFFTTDNQALIHRCRLRRSALLTPHGLGLQRRRGSGNVHAIVLFRTG